MSRFLLLICLCVLGVLVSCKSLSKPEEPTVVSAVEVVPEPVFCSFEPASSPATPSCKVEPLTAEPVTSVAFTVEPRPEPEAQPLYTYPVTKESVSEEVAEHYMTIGRLQILSLVLLVFFTCMIFLICFLIVLIIRELRKSGN